MARSSIMLLLLLSLGCASSKGMGGVPAERCNRHFFDGHPYWFCTEAKDWESAEARCNTRPNRHLVTIEGIDEHQWLAYTANKYVAEGYGWWHGFNDRATEGNWEWVSGSTSSWTNWDSETGEPNDLDGEDCGTFLHQDMPNDAWNDLDCDLELPFVCERVRMKPIEPTDHISGDSPKSAGSR